MSVTWSWTFPLCNPILPRHNTRSPSFGWNFIRSQSSRQTIAEMQTQAAIELAESRLRQPCRKVLESLQEHWGGLTRFVEDLRVPLDNNASERANRGPAVGRKNYYGSGSLWSGRLATMLFSLFATLARNNVNPRLWLTWYLQACAENGGTAPAQTDLFLPWNLGPYRRQSFLLETHNTS